MKKRAKNLFFTILIVLFVLFIYFLLYTYFPKYVLKCAFYEITSLSCPGCGISRMLSRFICFEVIEGVKYNYFLGITFPFLIGILVYSGYLYVCDKKSGRMFNGLCYSYVVLLIVWGIARNIIGV